MLSFSESLQHKLGGDRFESFPAVPVNAENRLKDEGPVREIDVCSLAMYPNCISFISGMDRLRLQR